MSKNDRHTLLAKIHSIKNIGEGIFLAVAVSSLIVGILVDVFVLRIACLMLMMCSGLLLFASWRAKRLNIQPGLKGEHSLFHSHSEGTKMKKFVFDDFQLHAKADHAFEEKHDVAPVVHHRSETPSSEMRHSPSMSS